MEHIKTKINHIKILLSEAKKINDKLDFIFSTSKKIVSMSTIADKIREIENALLQLNDVNDDIPAMRVGGFIGVCDLAFAELSKSFPSLDMISSSASQSFVFDTFKDINLFNNMLSSYIKDAVNSDINNFLIDKLIQNDPDDVENMYQSNKSAVSLYAAYLQHKFDNTDKSEHQKFYDMLERAKTINMVGPNYIAADAPNKEIPPLQRYGVMPVRQRLTVDELTKLYLGHGCTSGTCDIGSFLQMMAAASINVLVVYNITSYPIEFNIWRLINAEDAKGYIFPPAAGINRKIMQRLATISEVGTNADKQSYGYKAVPHENKPGGSWVIVRTINGTHWDAMSNNIMAVSKDVYNFDNLYVAENVVKKIIRGPSPRIDIYNEQKNVAFAQLLKQTIDVDNETKVNNKPLIDTLIHRITNRIISYVDDSLVPLPTNQKKLEEAIMDPNFVTLANIEMLRTYAECGTDAELPVHELVGSFISDVDNTIIVQFTRNLKLNMIDMGPKEKIFKEYSGDPLKTRLYNLFVDIIKKSVSSTIRSKENVYEKLLIKNNILKAMQ